MLSPVAPSGTRCALFGYQSPDGQFDVLRDGREEAALIPRDGVSCHTELRCEFALSETEEEPPFPKLPTGQAEVRLPEGAQGVNLW